MENTELLVVIQPELNEVALQIPLEKSIAETILIKYVPSLSNLSDLKNQIGKINFDNPTELDCKIARELRLSAVKIRTGAKNINEEGKSNALLIQKLENSANGIVEASCKMFEKQCEGLEKYREIAEAKRKEELKQQRSELILPYVENVSIYPLGELSEDAFKDLLDGLKYAHDKKIEDAKKIEEERIATEKFEREEKIRIDEENKKLKAENEAKEKLLQEQKLKADAERKVLEDKAIEEKRIWDENASRVQAEHHAMIKEQQEKADKEKAIQESNLKAEREAKEKLEAKIKADKDRLEKEKLAEKKRMEDEIKAKELEEKKLAKAPDKEKLKLWIKNLQTVSKEIKIDGLKNLESTTTANLIQQKFEGFILWANTQIESL